MPKLTLILPPEIAAKLVATLTESGSHETGGILMAEHVGVNRFAVRDLTIHARGAIASFLRRIEDAWSVLRSFFERTQCEYERFNYIGEWHSHPLFSPVPSARDHQSMYEIISETAVGARFVVLLVVKLDSKGILVGSVHTYLPDEKVHEGQLVIEPSL